MYNSKNMVEDIQKVLRFHTLDYQIDYPVVHLVDGTFIIHTHPKFKDAVEKDLKILFENLEARFGFKWEPLNEG